jgi:hypothetical protein
LELEIVLADHCDTFWYKTIQVAIESYLNQLLLPEEKQEVSIHVVVDKFKKSMKKETNIARIRKNKKTGSFLIKIKSNVVERDLLIALAHECVHIKQHIREEIVFNDKHVFWHGEDYGESKKNRNKNAPWEKEAREKQILLLKNFILQRCFSFND